MRLILQTWCQMQRIYSSLRYVNCGPEIYNAITVSYNQASIFNLTVLCCHWRCLDNSTRVILQTWWQYSAQPPVYAMWIVLPAICYVVTALYIQALIFNWTYLRWYWRYVENSMRLILQTWCQMQRIYSSLRYVNCGPEIYNAITVSYNQASIFNLTVLCCHWRCLDNSTRFILQT
jgi:hypothetical protein